MKSKTTNNLPWIILSIILVLLIIIIGIYIYKTQTCPSGFVCMNKESYYKMSSEKPKEIQVINTTVDTAPIRDQKVLADPLYPPLNRTDRQTFNSVVRETNARNINISSGKDIGDSYRLVGYLINKDSDKDAGGNNWKLMARQKDRNESDFYIIPTNKDYDVKVPLTSDVFVGQRLKDVYSIPKEISLKSPMLNSSSYEFVELPKTDFTDHYV